MLEKYLCNEKAIGTGSSHVLSAKGNSFSHNLFFCLYFQTGILFYFFLIFITFMNLLNVNVSFILSAIDCGTHTFIGCLKAIETDGLDFSPRQKARSVYRSG